MKGTPMRKGATRTGGVVAIPMIWKSLDHSRLLEIITVRQVVQSIFPQISESTKMCGENDSREVSIFLGAWKAIVLGTILWLASAICIYRGKKQYAELVFTYERFLYWFCLVMFVATILHTLSGVTLLFGLWKDYKRVFFVGMIMGNIMPLVLIFTGILPVFQFLCVIRAFSYYKMNWR